ncbi:MAG: DUF5615 family PIN-like protein [Cyclobacteriaceae bacterium]|nr:DUF5615 family PIN-like protein [Cyclobacteriaceae bacterium]
MKLLFDNNLSVKLPRLIGDSFHGSSHVYDLKIDRLPDKEIFSFAGKNDFTIVTKDKDFYHLLNTFGPPPKIVWVNVGNRRNEEVVKILLNHIGGIREFIKSNRSLLVISS